ncbi:MAG: acyl carrier protein [Actinobacteria bacterium]|nr:acyl carrier protein [Actinomycetota bacterium]
MAGDRDRDRVTVAVREVVGRILPALPPGELRGDRHLRDLGADSVDRVEIILAVLEHLDLDVSLARFSELPDIDALVDVLVMAGRTGG